MVCCRVCLKTISAASKFDHYHNACVSQFFGSMRNEPKINIPSTQFQREARQSQGKGMSISGVQAKLAASLVDRRVQLSSKTGDYIVKPCPTAYPGLPANEHLTMQLARLVGHETAECALVAFEDGELAYITKRYDRRPDGKIHQEDMMQAMGVANSTPDAKYGGSYEGIAKTLFVVTGNGVQPAEFISRLMFMYLVGNGDYHLKNISLLYPAVNTCLLTPIYDAVNTHLYDDPEFLCLDFFEGDVEPQAFQTNGFYTLADFVELGERVGVTARYITRRAAYLAKHAAGMEEMIDHSEMSAEMKAQYVSMLRERLAAIVGSQ